MTTPRRHLRESDPRRWLRAPLLVVLAVLSACAADGGVGPMPDRTGGLVIEVYVRRGEGQFVRYRVERTGQIRFAGGFPAQNRRWTWTGDLTDDEIARLRELVEVHGWATRDPESTGQPPATVYEIEVREPGVRRRFSVTGDHPDVGPVVDLLASAAARRNADVMDALPRAGLEERE